MQSWAILAQNLVEQWARPFEPRDMPTDQIHRAYKRLRAHQLKAGYSKVRRAYYGQAGEPTYLALKAQADTVRNENPDSPWFLREHPRATSERLTRGRDESGGDYIETLRAGAERLRRADPEFAAEYERALRQAFTWLDP